jgi:eukaryotic-like serine/threonine-protein kinase
MTNPSPTEEAIFLASLDKATGPERIAYVAAACAGNEALHHRVLELLAGHDTSRGPLDAPPVAVGATADGGSERPGTQIGSYKLLQKIGEGGFGVVYMAEQVEPVRRRVALKVIKPGMDTRHVIARFEAERQALAVMDHPHIARVLDGGTTASGRPYFVMELVRGTPITEYCDENSLPVRERLQLFASVCQAIQHAHTKGIIHRDIKPTNVLVTRQDGQAVVKVIDFGIAKAIGQRLTDKTVFTDFAQMIGTPLYMSPEQAELSGTDIDTRSDVYSLGVLLYELLTGSTPVSKEQLKRAAFDEIRRIIREDEPQKPSTRVSSAESAPSIAAQRHTEPARLTKLIRGELDWIVMKALEKDRNRRYETANGFALDIQRYLHDEPVQACPPTVGYRLRKFAYRNCRALATAALLAVALLVTLGAVAVSVGWTARDKAARQAAVEKEAEGALGEAERWAEQENWSEALAAVKRGEGVLAGGGSDELRRRLQQLRKDLELIFRLEQIELVGVEVKNFGFEWKAVDQGYEQAFIDNGIDVLNLPVEEAAARIQARERMAIPLVVALDYWASTASSRTGAEREKMRKVAGAVDPDPWRLQVREAVQKGDGKALAELANTLNVGLQPRNSLVVLKHGLLFHGLPDKSLEVLKILQRQNPGDFWVNYWLARETNVFRPAEREDARAFATAAVAIRPTSAAAHHYLGIILRESGRLDEAIRCFDKAIQLEPNHGSAFHNRGWTFYLQGNLDEAIVCCRKAIELSPKNPWAYFYLGNTLRAQNKLDEALAHFQKTIELDPKFAYPYHDIGWILHLQGKLDESIPYYNKAIELNPMDMHAYSYRGVTLRTQKKLDEAIASFQKVVEIEPKCVWGHKDLGDALLARGKVNEAIVSYRQAIMLAANARRHGDKNLHVSLHRAAWALATDPNPQLRNPAFAVELANEAVQLHPVGDYWNTLGVSYYRAGDYTAAEKALRKSMEQRMGGDSFDWFFLAATLWQQQGNQRESREWYDKAVEWMDKNKPDDEQLRRIRAEVADLLDIAQDGPAEVTPPPGMEK